MKTPVEFGAKLDLSIDESGYGRVEKISFDAYNECGCLEDAVERYRKRTGHYPMRILADIPLLFYQILRILWTAAAVSASDRSGRNYEVYAGYEYLHLFY